MITADSIHYDHRCNSMKMLNGTIIVPTHIGIDGLSGSWPTVLDIPETSRA